MKTRTITLAALLALIAASWAPIRANAQEKYPRAHQVNSRLKRQAGRTRNGIKSGQLTKHEARSVKRSDARIHASERRDRIAHSGHLTTSEDKRLNHRLNRNSSRIYKDKHNNKTR
jgi:hypothetical protein